MELPPPPPPPEEESCYGRLDDLFKYAIDVENHEENLGNWYQVPQSLNNATEDSPCIASRYDYLRSYGAESQPPTLVDKLRACSRIWFYPTISRSEALEMLREKAIGVFLVRNSSQVGSCALSMRQDNPYIQHYRVQQMDAGLQVEGASISFNTLEELVAHYAEFLSGGMPTTLTLPRVLSDCYTMESLHNVAHVEEVFMETLRIGTSQPYLLDESQKAHLRGDVSCRVQDSSRVVSPLAKTLVFMNDRSDGEAAAPALPPKKKRGQSL